MLPLSLDRKGLCTEVSTSSLAKAAGEVDVLLLLLRAEEEDLFALDFRLDGDMQVDDST
jgi:hypothetical protein